ncbi:AP2 domain family protein [Babesia bovis T2Bo]|uniref:AP2/ERF domain-containing protein n=1 Tax=Babesia bovis TaxID=5865 RepID=A7AV24_BABBO|nr:AP2 domain family protein [Babesia bovis T2Bo]EDO05650.1 AP2 domain family protein [Babesia bovis T2Bo]|eukprot:XP_001609218.1 hypothetical protein [Babesia bovis T2Bo]
MMEGDEGDASLVFEASRRLDNDDLTHHMDVEPSPCTTSLKADSDTLEDLLSCIEKWQNTPVGSPLNKQVPMVNVDEPLVDIDVIQDNGSDVSFNGMSNQCHEHLHGIPVSSSGSVQGVNQHGLLRNHLLSFLDVPIQYPLSSDPQMGVMDSTKSRNIEPLKSVFELPSDKNSEDHKCSREEFNSMKHSEVRPALHGPLKVENEVIFDEEDRMKLSVPLPQTTLSESARFGTPIEPRIKRSLHESLGTCTIPLQNLKLQFQLRGSEPHDLSKECDIMGSITPRNARKRLEYFPVQAPKRMVHRRISNPGSRVHVVPAPCEGASHMKSGSQGPLYEVHNDRESSLNKTTLSHDGLLVPPRTFSNGGSLSWTYPEDDPFDGECNLVYLGSCENSTEERLSDSEENPLLHQGTPDPNPLITANDIANYGRGNSIQGCQIPVSTQDPQASRFLKDVSINCQIDQIRALGSRVKRVPKERVPQTHSVEVYAQMAAEFEKIRGVCYCRSDNSWTAWWTDRGRNRKKAFKVSRFGFHEARKMAIEHREAIHQKSLLPIEKRLTKEHAVEEPLVSDVDVTPRPALSEYSNSITSSPISSPVKGVGFSRMQTRGARGRPYVPGSQRMMSTTHDAGAVVATDEFDLNSMVTPRIDSDHNVNDTCDMSQPKVHGDLDINKVHPEKRLVSSIDDAIASSSTTANSPDFGSSGMSITPKGHFTLNSDVLDMMKLDSRSRSTLEAAISNLVCGVDTTHLPTGVSVQVLPQLALASEGQNVSVILVMHPEHQGCR